MTERGRACLLESVRTARRSRPAGATGRFRLGAWIARRVLRACSRLMLCRRKKLLVVVGLIMVAGAASAAVLKTRVVGQSSPGGEAAVTLGELGREPKRAQVGPPFAAPGGTARVIGTPGQSWGDMAATVSWARAHEPYALLMHVTSKPPQSVAGKWATVCTKDFVAGSQSGRIAARTPFTRPLRFPMRHPMNCSVGASARLKGNWPDRSDAARAVCTALRSPSGTVTNHHNLRGTTSRLAMAPSASSRRIRQVLSPEGPGWLSHCAMRRTNAHP
jgi:hypothetical protein